MFTYPTQLDAGSRIAARDSASGDERHPFDHLGPFADTRSPKHHKETE